MATNSTGLNSKLVALNSAPLGAQMPEIALADGTKAQAGISEPLLDNHRTYNTAHAAGDKDQMAELETALSAGLPVLDRIGVSDLFSPNE